MYLDDNPDYKTVWQLAHDWIGDNRNETNTSALSPKLREKLIWLVIAIRNRKITARTRKGSIFEDNSIITVIDDFPHFIKTRICLTKGIFDKDYLDSLYAKREEVIDLCIKTYHEPPLCWMPKQLVNEHIVEAKNYRPKNEIEDRIRCQAIASTSMGA